MKTWKILTILTLVVIGAALVTTSAYAYMGNRAGTTVPYGTTAGTTYPNGVTYGYGGMMGGGYNYGYSAPQVTTPVQPSTPAITTPTVPTTQYYGGFGCGRAFGGYSNVPPVYSNGTYAAAQLNITTAVTIAQSYLTQLNNPNLVLKQVEEYAQNFYVQIGEKDTGFGAFELLINKYTGSISPEMGPNTMWNTKYGMMSGGMMGGYGYGYTSAPTTTMPVNATQATANAQQFLNANYPGTTIGDVTTFYGYYTLEALSGSTPYGMLSVNGYTGQVWYHTWHGAFIQEWEP